MKKEYTEGRFLGRFKSIQSAIFTTVAIVLLGAVLIVTVVSLNYTRKAVLENSTMYTQTIIRQMNQNIDSYIDYMENIASVIADSEDVQKYLSGDLDNTEYRRRLLEQFHTILEGRDDICNLGLVRADGKALLNDGTDTVNPNIRMENLEWFRNAWDDLGISVLTSSHVQHIIEGERPWVITLSKGICSREDPKKPAGVFFIDLNYNAIRELCDQNTIGDAGYVFILDQDGNIVYHPQQQQLYNELQTENIDEVMQVGSDAVLTGTGNSGKVYCISKSEKTGWSVAGCMNVGKLLRSSRQAQLIYVLTALVLMIIAIILSSVVARNITLPIQRLRDSMAKVQEGDFGGPDLIVTSENEIGSLTGSFNVMTHRIEELMEQNVRDQEEKRKSELKALQSQINPHFLYNTLDSIIWMAEGKKNEEVVLMTAALARLLRQSISNEDELVSIATEIEYARSYLTIQKMRYKDKMEFQIQVDPSLNHVKIIKLVLQPIIENAIYHGLKYKETKGLLVVRGYRQGGNAVLEISDDGTGMDEHTLAHIFERHKVNYHSNGVGVYNVQKRLQLYYGADYGISYRSEPGKGTTATITIPAEQEEYHEEL